ncbi:hypothetical protein WJX82_005830 [Trebouxia sp. C0006]
MEDDGSNDGGVKSSTDKVPASKQSKRRFNQIDHPCFLCFTQRKSGDAGRRWHHTTRGKEITQISLCDKCYQQEYNGRKVPGAPLTQTVLAAKQADVVASDSEEDSDAGLTELEAKRQRTSKSSTQAATQAPAGPLAHAESSRQESRKTAPEANCVSPAAVASDASPQPQFPFLLFKQIAHDASKRISRSVIAASLGPQQRPGAEAPPLQTSVPEVENFIQQSSCLANPVRLSLPEQLPPALPMGPGQTSQADLGSVGPQAENVQGSTCEAVCSELMQLNRHLLSEGNDPAMG